MNRGPRSRRNANGICVELCGSALTGGDGIEGVKLDPGAGIERADGAVMGAGNPCPGIAGDADPSLGGGVPRIGADIPCRGIAEDAETGLGKELDIGANVLCA